MTWAARCATSTEPEGERAQLEQALTNASIAYTNLLPVMETALSTYNIYPPTDGHPNAAGYKVVAAYLAPIVLPLFAAN